MTNTLCLDENYSTTRLIFHDECLMVNEKEDNLKLTAGNALGCKIKNSTFALPEGENRCGEGGLRTKDFFKQSYPDKPLISIITVVYNGEKYLEETVQSVINQTYDNVEYIIIDGGSTDGTLDIIRKYEHAIDYWVSERDKGIYDAMNKGICFAQGDIIGLLNADDIYVNENILSLVSNTFIENKCDLLHAKVVQVDSDNQVLSTIGQNVTFEKLLFKMKVAHPTVFITKNLYFKHGLFSTQYKIAADYEMMLRLWKYTEKRFINDVLVRMRAEGISNTQVYASYKEAHDIAILYGLNSKKAHLNFIKELIKHYFLVKPFRKLFQ